MLNEPCNGFGEFIQVSRELNNLSVEMLAGRLGVSKNIVERLESESLYPSYSLIVKLSNVLNVNESKLNDFIWCENKKCGNLA
ncbi:transcriptional regulator with XRE-family HTH domain [Planomicrobium stackebrandtii]|uniref:Transcriptional regulator with XRE-family HTH domain n=1 Tax=Planomicrobium stackebrandtii TaxID=253160 RepID=A0ABU0GQF4_9BACL|nr:helix-turn-helix transcriptional regulator [Planomicrobium stackebrandtii]MDQ0427209.1 transcriptional regulator with XRE-family HTH domain [Planomicrobium stackebrandtii]